MGAGSVVKKVKRNSATMTNALMSAKEMSGYDHCCGIHGAARERKGIKRGTSAARRRVEKTVIKRAVEEMNHDESVDDSAPI
jgi:hypothetical protein